MSKKTTTQCSKVCDDVRHVELYRYLKETRIRRTRCSDSFPFPPPPASSASTLRPGTSTAPCASGPRYSAVESTVGCRTKRRRTLGPLSSEGPGRLSGGNRAPFLRRSNGRFLLWGRTGIEGRSGLQTAQLQRDEEGLMKTNGCRNTPARWGTLVSPKANAKVFIQT